MRRKSKKLLRGSLYRSRYRPRRVLLALRRATVLYRRCQPLAAEPRETGLPRSSRPSVPGTIIPNCHLDCRCTCQLLSNMQTQCVPSYCAVYPPSTGQTLAVTNEASSEARNATTAAISSGCPIRPIGCSRFISAWISGSRVTLARQRRIDEGGRNRVDPNTLAGKAHTHLPGHLHDRPLAVRVGREAIGKGQRRRVRDHSHN